MFDIVKLKAYLGICQMLDCCKSARSRGLCDKHFQWYRAKDFGRRAEFNKYALSHSESRIRIADAELSKMHYFARQLIKRHAEIFVTSEFILAVDGNTVYRFTPDGRLSKARLKPA